MNQTMQSFEGEPETPKTAGTGKTWAMIGVLVLLCATNVYLLSRVGRLQTEQATMQQQLANQMTKVEETTLVRSGKMRQDIEGFKQEIVSALEQNSKFATAEARKETGWLAQKMTKAQREQQEQVIGEIRNVEGATNEAHRKVGEVRTDLDHVKSDVAATQGELSETVNMLSTTVDQVGALDGEVSANRTDIAHLRRLNERDRVAFTLGKSQEMTRLGDVQLRLKKTDAKRNKYWLEVQADDKKFVKAEKNVNEPVQFYMTGAGQPYEIVVTSITKDRVTGYISKPKPITRS